MEKNEKIEKNLNKIFHSKIGMEYKCTQCGKILKSKKSLLYHTKNKVCEKSTFMCEKCNLKMSSKQMLEYHIEKKVCEKKVCGKKEKPKITLKKEFLEKYKDYTKAELLLELAETKGENKALKENPCVVNNNNQFNFIFPKEFGKEEVSHILSKLPNLLHIALTDRKSVV